MKKLLLVFTFFYCQAIFAQSPYLMVNLAMDSVKAGSTKFNIDMKICEPVNGSAIKDHFSNERSAINFKALKENDIRCKEYISNDSKAKEFYSYHFGNQVFAWEKILICRIVNWSSATWEEPMYVILPVKMKSFVTYISLRDIQYQSGKLIWLDDTGVIDNSHAQQIAIALNNIQGIDTESWTLKKILD
ncbi:MAG: hypothetical protein ABIN74_11595 [Ferruginibacter sp.]